MDAGVGGGGDGVGVGSLAEEGRMIATNGKFGHHKGMIPKPLIETNRHLRDPKQYNQQLSHNVASSTAVEIGTLSKKKLADLFAQAVKRPANPGFVQASRL